MFCVSAAILDGANLFNMGKDYSRPGSSLDRLRANEYSPVRGDDGYAITQLRFTLEQPLARSTL